MKARNAQTSNSYSCDGPLPCPRNNVSSTVPTMTIMTAQSSCARVQRQPATRESRDDEHEYKYCSASMPREQTLIVPPPRTLITQHLECLRHALELFLGPRNLLCCLTREHVRVQRLTLLDVRLQRKSVFSNDETPAHHGHE